MDLKEQLRRASEAIRRHWPAANDPLEPVARRAPRFAQQLDLEERICCFCPNANEASELISAIAVSLKRRHDNPTEALLQLTLAQRALDRLDDGLEVDASGELEALQEQVRNRRPK